MVGDMAYEKLGERSLDYLPCRYAGSGLLFRGPRRRLSGRYAVFLGSTETYGKFIWRPFPALIEKATGVTCVNLGFPNAGVDVFLNDPMVLGAARRAFVTVVQVPCAQNMTNRFYAVHPRRNDRFVEATGLLRSVFCDVDFTEFHFTRHMLGHLQRVSPGRFAMVREELQRVWVERMRLLLGRIDGPVMLLWFSNRRPGEDANGADLAHEPAYVTRQMLNKLSEMVTQTVEVVASPEALAAGTAGMICSDIEAAAARDLPGPLVHADAAFLLSPLISGLAE
ncbi:hypothetical protein PEL8287_02610 [Roseovarius litorisediminis]|uniref:DUF6473 domain-containing protein n=1 Tax=Roseovarius litorisediminis TaxID=1312363 RepID=A0A1Y5SZF5_9RHOB|nr:DUF6473 family protein [Roseovarius litorisediminis]SLN50135.1 hypothetical protein PEL8287_02610 [Roseovarius litorisediminis]